MISRYTRSLLTSLLAILTSACTYSDTTADDPKATVTSVIVSATPSAANTAAQSAGNKTYMSAEGHTITLSKAYMVISNATIERDPCGMSFTAAVDGLLDVILPPAYAHAAATPTSTGVPFVIDILADDDAPVAIGSMSPSVADYCGATIDVDVADIHSLNLPTGAGEPDMVGRTVYIEGSYTLAGGGSGNIAIASSITTLAPRQLLLSALMMISTGKPNGAIDLAINYDTWFDTVDLTLLEAGDADELDQVLQNITDSIHQL